MGKYGVSGLLSNYRNVFHNVVNMMCILKQDGTLRYLKIRD